MFTGIVRERGRVVRADGGPDGLALELEAPDTAALSAIGDSVSIAGACLTVTSVADGRMSFHAVPETIERSSLGRLQAGEDVNVEPALRVGDPLGGHYVQGHVDAVGAVRALDPEGEGARLWVDAPPEVLRYCVDKGSIAVEGVSLTIAGLDAEGFAIALVPHTLEATTLGALVPGDPVNLEVDVLAKYVEKLVAGDGGGTIRRA
ncbi:MAG TPA: riboflavin synthase [Gaiellaceae bacterium]|nr:riboflavin synthase [Gaiellaceae bacterium]